MLGRVTMDPNVLGFIADDQVRQQVAGCSVAASGALFDPSGASGGIWTPTTDGHLLVIGTVTDDQEVCLDMGTGEILVRSPWDHQVTYHVNQDLPRFIQSIDMFEEALPFYGHNPSFDERETARAAFIARLAQIDQSAVTNGETFWQMIGHDIASGDYGPVE
jgi:hypothetical protein